MAGKLSEAQKARALLSLLDEMSFKGSQRELITELAEWLQQIAARDSGPGAQVSRIQRTAVPDVDYQRWK